MAKTFTGSKPGRRKMAARFCAAAGRMARSKILRRRLSMSAAACMNMAAALTRLRAGVVVVSERTDGSVWLIEAGAAPRRIETPEDCRYADFELDLPRRRVLAVREDHRSRPLSDPKAAIVALPLDPGGAETILVEGPDFLSSPRLAPGGERLAWIAWDHPDMPWDGTRLFVSDVTKEGALEATRLAAGETPEAIVQPEWSANGTLYFCSDRTGWWNLYALRGHRYRILGAGRSARSAVRIGFSASTTTIFSPMGGSSPRSSATGSGPPC